MTISFVKFVEMLDPSYEMPEYMKSFLKDMESNKRYCVCMHRHAGRNYFNKAYNEYLEGENK